MASTRSSKEISLQVAQHASASVAGILLLVLAFAVIEKAPTYLLSTIVVVFLIHLSLALTFKAVRHDDDDLLPTVLQAETE